MANLTPLDQLFNTAITNRATATNPAALPAGLTPPSAGTAPPSPANPVVPRAGSPAPGQPYNTPIPGEALYGQAALAAKTAYQNALTRLNDKRQTTLRQYGYSGQVDPNDGTVKDVAVDGSNPYGYFQQLLAKSATATEQAQDAAESRHLGTHGLGGQGITQAQRQHGADSATLGTTLTQTLGGFQDEQTQAAYTRDQALYQAELEAARLAIQNSQFNPGDYTGINVDGTEDAQPDDNPAQQNAPAAKANPTSNAAKLAAQLMPKAVKVAANKTGGSKNKKQGIFAIH